MGFNRIGCTTSTFGGALALKLKAMASAGFSETEFWPKDLFEYADGPTVAIDLLKQNGLTVSIYQALRNYEGSPPLERTQKLGIAEQMMDQMALLGCDLLALPTNSGEDCSGDPDRIAGDLVQLGDLARSRGVRVALEPLAWGRWINDYRDGWGAVRAANHQSVGLMLDSFHLFAQGSPLEDIAAIPAEKIFMVEISDYASSALGIIEIARNYRLFPGEGHSPMEAFLRQVEKTGYAGSLSVEVFSAVYRQSDPFEVARRAADSAVRALQSIR